MKVARLLPLVLILSISSVALMQGTSYAAPSKPIAVVGPANASDRSHVHGSARVNTASRSKQLLNSRKSLLGHTASRHQYQPSLDKSSGAEKAGSIKNETVNTALPVRRLSVIRPYLPSPKNVRHRGPNPAVVAGSTNLASRNTGAINGTGMNRRP